MPSTIWPSNRSISTTITVDRFHLVMDIADRVPRLQAQAAHIKQQMRDNLIEHTQYIHGFGEDMPEIRDWKWAH
jgi:xylulose-5-phosphate/fructose-6-phosphate phosphoketolase